LGGKRSGDHEQQDRSGQPGQAGRVSRPRNESAIHGTMDNPPPLAVP
jgi:hypothetical protein